MASRGPVVTGTDGTDFIHRESVATHYHISAWPPKKPVSEIALNKGRLKKCIFMHLLLTLLMVIKLTPDILDKMDIFILEVEELEVPQVYFGLINLFSTVPILLASMIYFSEFYKFCTEGSSDLALWQGYPVAALWYAFILFAMQVHIFTLVFSFKLIIAWKTKGSLKKNN